MRRRAGATAALLVLAATGALAACGGTEEEPVRIGLVLKQEENPYWLTIRDVAEETAGQEGATVVSAAGTSDVDVAGQEAAIDAMVADGVDGILLTPNDSAALVPAIERARAAGVLVIALDTPVEPASAVDALFATDNRRAGALLGQYAAGALAERGETPVIATLDLAPGIASGEERHAGFLEGFGGRAGEVAVVAAEDTEGDRELGRAAMERVLADAPEVNVVYTVNEPAALGALDALEAADVDADDITLVSVDGGCAVMTDGVRPGSIDATAQQYPENMAREGVRAVVAHVRDGEDPPDYLDTGVELVTGSPVSSVSSRDVEFGVRNCWG